MNKRIMVTCPECGYTETTGIVPTFTISFELSAQPVVTSCYKCGYEQ